MTNLQPAAAEEIEHYQSTGYVIPQFRLPEDRVGTLRDAQPKYAT